MKILKKKFIVFSLIVICIFLCLVVFKIINAKKETVFENKTDEVINISNNLIGIPAHLKIPSINVDASVEQVGLTLNGAMDTPKGGENVGCFNLGQRPGEAGTAVITGHYGTWKNGKGSVFDNLNKIKVGDKIYVEDENKSVVVFVVRELRNYDPKADATGIFSSDDEKDHLNLITCEGVWSKDSKSFSERLVVFTDKE